MEEKTIKLFTAAKELNIGTGTIIDFLASKGYNVQRHPTTALTQDMYNTLLREFAIDRIIREEAKQIVIGKIRRDSEIALKLPILSLQERALQRIKECEIQGSPLLDLGNHGLNSTHFSQGEALDRALAACTELKILILSDKASIYLGKLPFDWPEPTENGRANFFTHLPPSISELRKLTHLFCCGSVEQPWRIAMLNNIKNFVCLEYLDFSYNIFESIRPFTDLPKLAYLNISHNRLNTFKLSSKFLSLRLIDASHNLINGLAIATDGIELDSLDLSYNKIKSVAGLEKLMKVRQIYLSGNQISKIHEFAKFIDAQPDCLLRIDDNPLIGEYKLQLLPGENHLPYLEELLYRVTDASTKVKVDYPVKILLFGNHASGKSSLVNYLTDKADSGSTHILRIVDYRKAAKKLLPDAVFFDFGGQDFYHGVYRAFVSQGALQLILFDERSDINHFDVDNNQMPIVNFNRRYWLGQKRYQDENMKSQTPFVMIQTHADNEKEALAIDYSDYQGYQRAFFISFADLVQNDLNRDERNLYETGREYLKSFINLMIKKIQTSATEPSWYRDFLNFIFDKNDKTHESTPLVEILGRYGSDKQAADERMELMRSNLTQLHRHGTVLYYAEIPELADVVWLDPEKLVLHIQTNILSKVFGYSQEHISQGIIAKKSFEAIVKDKKILSLLVEQRVIFLHDPKNDPNEQEYIVPNFLPLADKHDHEHHLFTFGFDQPDFVLRFIEFIPFGFINQLICFFGKQPDMKRFWRNQVVFTLDRAVKVFIELDFEQLEIKVNFHRKKNADYSNQQISEYLFFCMIGLYWNMGSTELPTFSDFISLSRGKSPDSNQQENRMDYWTSLRTSEKFAPKDAYLSIDNQHYVACTDLLAIGENDYIVRTYLLKEGKIDFSAMKELPARNFASFSAKKLAIMKKIFVSYSKFDEDYLQDFEDHLISLKTEGVATFNCKKIEFGKEWDQEIKKQLDECDIMICLVSVKFLNTDYITKIEVKRAIEQNKMIIPIIIKACDWENSEIGKYQAAQRGRIVSLDNNQRLFGFIKAHSSEERDAFWTDIVRELRQKIAFN